ncbi:MAG TPA: hypothetical protein VJI12_04030 [archaeon]|nr:hypothetical protein [archaeon]
MKPIVTGVAIGFFAAFFLSMYAEFLFTYKLPFALIYGVIAPFLSAIAILVLVIADKAERKRSGLDWFEEKKDE